jgi:hypothetical protein
MADLWIANNQATVREGAADYTLSVFAQFDDGTVGDISSHRYLTFASANSAVCTVDAAGVLHGQPGQAGNSTTVDVDYAAAFTSTVPVTVSAPLATKREILSLIRGNGDIAARRNLVILAEGYTAAEGDKFAEHALKVANTLFDSRHHAPYDLLADSFNVWAAFEASPEGGLTLGPPVLPDGAIFPAEIDRLTAADLQRFESKYSVGRLVEFAGLPGPSSPATAAAARADPNWATLTMTFPPPTPGSSPQIQAFNPAKLDDKVFDLWKTQSLGKLRLVRPRDTLLGLIGGSRLASTWPRADLGVGSWFIPDPMRTLRADLRRDPNGAFAEVILGYLRSLRWGNVVSDPNYDVGQHWGMGGKDHGMALILVNDDVGGGTRFGPAGPPVAVGLKGLTRVVLSGAEPRFDHVPVGAAGEPNLAHVTSIAAHELAHAFGLEDEYEGADDARHARVRPQDVAGIEGHPNTTARATVADTADPSKIDPTKIKWNWHRIALSSALAKPATGGGVGTPVKVTLTPGAGSLWEEARSASLAAFLRAPLRSGGELIGPLFVNSIAGDDLTLLFGVPLTPGQFPAGATLYLPKRDGSGSFMSLVHPKVREFMRITGKPLATHAPAPCDEISMREAIAPDGVADFSYPRNRGSVIGLYEGAATFNCEAYRSAGSCLMRRTYRWTVVWRNVYIGPSIARDSPFCFVCKYSLVDIIDPSKHAQLDAQYPEDC